MPTSTFSDILSDEVTRLKAQFPDLAEGLSRACALVRSGAVFVEESGRDAMVRSSDGATCYYVNGHCPCPASQYHTEPCKHRLALRLYQKVCDRLAEDQDTEAGAPPVPPMAAEHLITIQGRPFVRFEGLLDLAHRHGLVSLETTVVQVTLDQAVCQATARFQDGRVFTDIGDATPESVAKHLKPHFIRMAATRASARALRRALNISACAVEELGEETAR
jgi:hypothetical protein